MRPRLVLQPLPTALSPSREKLLKPPTCPPTLTTAFHFLTVVALKRVAVVFFQMAETWRGAGVGLATPFLPPQSPRKLVLRVAESWKRWKHVSSHFRILAATFGWLGQRLSQPTNFGSQIFLPFNCLLTGWARGQRPSQPNGWD